jgi:hypothetical protein
VAEKDDPVIDWAQLETRARQCLGNMSRSYVEDAKAFAVVVLSARALEKKIIETLAHMDATQERSVLVVQENRDLRHENRILKERVTQLEREAITQVE